MDITYLGKKGKVSVTGVDQSIWSQITTTKIKTGRMLDSADQNVIVLGGRLAASYFDQPVGINKMVMMNSSAFRFYACPYGGLPMARGTAIVTLNSVAMALSVTVGILAGMIPACQASKLRPVGALKYE